ncbi:uncharacterized protein LOC100841685 isoform X1 [Brachypodium distachyon]|uniref:uncharacterized protein LOC100841685 isoform X1 n=1 Tax=Brachypodium distachyon TaxID=15368 RepID=UPI00071D6CC9|nr:uncharacterized protein LOC100841685 isoform X1 [Brachypodium distachyon]|eukprot:XP_014758701.1 uncharacterized protein LOC100841685 isoform X1 [Brachypodium distachyon]
MAGGSAEVGGGAEVGGSTTGGPSSSSFPISCKLRLGVSEKKAFLSNQLRAIRYQEVEQSYIMIKPDGVQRGLFRFRHNCRDFNHNFSSVQVQAQLQPQICFSSVNCPTSVQGLKLRIKGRRRPRPRPQRKATTSSSSRSSATSEVQVLVLNGVAADGEGAAEEGTAEAAEDEGWSVASRPAALRRARP